MVGNLETPMTRINRAIELLSRGTARLRRRASRSSSYEIGRERAQTWADYLSLDLEHHPFTPADLVAFMRGLVEGGPTRSGHRTPAVIVTLPMDGFRRRCGAGQRVDDQAGPRRRRARPAAVPRRDSRRRPDLRRGLPAFPFRPWASATGWRWAGAVPAVTWWRPRSGACQPEDYLDRADAMAAQPRR